MTYITSEIAEKKIGKPTGMKFDHTGKRIAKSKNSKSLSQLLHANLLNDAKIICEYLKINIPEIVVVNNLSGGKCNMTKKIVYIGFQDYNRKTLIHELLHAKGIHHGRIKIGFYRYAFLSHDDRDEASKMLEENIFGGLNK